MKKLAIIILTLGVNFTSWGFPYLVNRAAVTADQVNHTDWTNFVWVMNAGSDQSFVFHTSQQGVSRVILRFGTSSSTTNYSLQWESDQVFLTSTGTVFQGYISRTNLPPNRVYFAEFIGLIGTNITSAGSSLGRGRITITSSLFNEDDWQPVVINQNITGIIQETDPVWGMEKTNYYTISEADVLFPTGTPIYVESDPLWTTASGAVWLAISGLTTGTPLYAETDPVFAAWLATNSAGFGGNFLSLNGGTVTGNVTLSLAELRVSGIGSDGIRLGSVATSSGDSKSLKLVTTSGIAQEQTHQLFSSFSSGRLIYNTSGQDNILAYLGEIANATSTIGPRITAVEAYTNRAALSVQIPVWSSADSTTNYAFRNAYVASTAATAVAVASLGTNVSARLASNVWASAASTTNFAPRTSFIAVSNLAVAAYPASNPAGYVTNAAGWSAFTATQTVNMNSNVLTGVTAIDIDVVRNAGGSTAIDVKDNEFVGSWSFEMQPDIPGYLTITDAAATYVAITNQQAGSVTNIGFGLVGDGLATPLAVDGNVVALQGGTITGRWIAVDNTVAGAGATVSGGSVNKAIAIGAYVGGGIENIATGFVSSVLGGQNNVAVGQHSSIAGGYFNTATGMFASVGGGVLNSAYGISATVPGGTANAAGDYAFAAGIGAKATNSGSFVYSGQGDVNFAFGSRGDNTFNVRAVGGTYFLSPFFNIADTNGNTVASFSSTGTTINGTVNFVGSPNILTIAAANTNFWRITTAPASNNSFGSRGQIAVSTSNVFIYNPDAAGTGTGRWIRVSGSITW